MGSSDKSIQDLADEHGVDAVTVRELLAILRERAGADHFYVFWTAGSAAQSPGAAAADYASQSLSAERIRSPIERAKSSEATVLEAAKQQQADIDAQASGQAPPAQ